MSAAVDAALGPAEDAGPIRVAAAIIEDAEGRLLFVRKHGTAIFLQPGGKIEPGEHPAEALVRELAEELGLALSPGELVEVGLFTAPAANEPGREVEARVYRAPLRGEPVAAAEIAEARWLPAAEATGPEIAPLSRDLLVPLVLAARA